MRILQVTTTATRRGAEVFASQLGATLTDRGHLVTTVCLEPPGRQDSLDFEALARGRTDPRSFASLVRRSRSSDVVVAHGGSTLIPVALASTVARRPFVYRNIGDPSYWGSVRGAGIRVGYPLRRAAQVVALYQGAADYMVQRYRLDPARVTVASNAVDPSRFPPRTAQSRREARSVLGVDDNRTLLGYLGNLSKEKRPGWALDTVESIQGATLIMGGAGPLSDELAHRALALGDRAGLPACRLSGQVTDPGAFLSALDLLLLPSATEGIPAVLLEAALVGVPTLATDVGGVADVMASVGGTSVPVHDLHGFIEAARRITEDLPAHQPDRSAVLRDHGIEAVADRWQQVLIRTVAGHPV